VLFTDLQGFTTISEELGPENLLDWLNGYMEAMVRIINAHGGVVNKFIGDSVMAVFGVPIARESDDAIARDALRAVECAVDMRERIATLNEELEKRGLPRIISRVGIFTGPLVAGCIGGSDRLEYTVLGDTVNVASRLEGFGKDMADLAASGGECRILAGEATMTLLGNRFETFHVGEVFLKGRKEAVRVYLVATRKGGD
jgi:adenylate cyclase